MKVHLLLLCILIDKIQSEISSEKAHNDSCYRRLEGNVCMAMKSNQCLSGTLNYLFTTTTFTNLTDIHAIETSLQRWEALRNVPKCWEEVRPLLCAVYLPKCQYNSKTNISLVLVPSKEICQVSRGHCGVMDQLWPEHLRCQHSSSSSGCLVS